MCCVALILVAPSYSTFLLLTNVHSLTTVTIVHQRPPPPSPIERRTSSVGAAGALAHGIRFRTLR